MVMQIQANVQPVKGSKRSGAVTPGTSSLKQIRTVADANRLMESKLYEKLQSAITEAGGESLSSLKPKDFTPEAVANRILQFVDNRVALERQQFGDGRADELLVQARKGIEDGFNQAKTILEGLGVFNNDIEENANTTYDLLQKGLDQLSKKESNNIVGSTAITLEQHQSNELSITLETTQGDKLELQITHSGHTQSVITGDTIRQEDNRSDAISFRLSGDINEQERVAIDKLVSDAVNLSDTFFSGNAHLAFKKAMELGYDTESIASFSLSMQNGTTSKITEAYNSVQRIADKNGYSRGIQNSVLPTIREFMQQLAATINKASETGVYAKPDSAVLDSFNAVTSVDENKRGLANALEHQSGESLGKFSQHLANVLQNQQAGFTNQ